MTPFPIISLHSPIGTRFTVLLLVEREDATYCINFKYALPVASKLGGFSYVVMHGPQAASSIPPKRFAELVLEQYRPSILIVSRWASEATVELAEECSRRGVSFVFHLDDLFFSLPEYLGETYHHAYGPDYLAALKHILSLSTVAWSSTPKLSEQLNIIIPDLNVVTVPGVTYLEQIIRKGGLAVWVKRQVHRMRHSRNKIVIGYMGSASHQKELDSIAPAIRNILIKFPEIRFEIIGCHCPHVLSDQPAHKVARFGSVPSYEQMLELLYLLDWDLGLVPLFDNLLNGCKTFTKFLEYTAAGIPVLASNVGMYAVLGNENKCTTIDRPDDLEERILRILASGESRLSMHRTAADFCRANYSPQVVGEAMLDNIMRIFRNIASCPGS